MLGVPLPFYKSPTLLLGFGLSPFVLARLWRHRPDVIHVAFPGACTVPSTSCTPRKHGAPGGFVASHAGSESGLHIIAASGAAAAGQGMGTAADAVPSNSCILKIASHIKKVFRTALN